MTSNLWFSWVFSLIVPLLGLALSPIVVIFIKLLYLKSYTLVQATQLYMLLKMYTFQIKQMIKFK